MVQDDDGALRRREGEERLFDELAVGEGVDPVLGRRLRARAGRRRRHAAHASGVPLRSARLLVAGADEEFREPGIEALRFTEPRELTPCLDHGLLDRVLGRVRLPEDLARHSQQPLTGRTDELLEGVLVAARSPTDQIGQSLASSWEPASRHAQRSRPAGTERGAAFINRGCAAPLVIPGHPLRSVAFRRRRPRTSRRSRRRSPRSSPAGRLSRRPRFRPS